MRRWEPCAHTLRLGDTVYAQDVVARSAAIEQQARRLKDVILDVVNAKDDER
jgi:hypothetical protein